MKLESAAFGHNQPMPSKYTCAGESINPPLTISDVPAETVAMSLIMHDPDAPAGDWTHWLLWNINPHITQIDENSVPPGAQQGLSSGGKVGYEGPCPPSGTHRYVFDLYALDSQLQLRPDITRGHILNAINNHLIAKCELIGLYTHSQ